MSEGAELKDGPDVVLNRLAYLSPTAQLFGKITIGEGSSVWPNVVMRAEVHEILIGQSTNIQDFVMVHVGERTLTTVGDDCSITHHATLHGCTIGDRCLFGINATIMDGAVIGENSIVAGHSIVTELSVFPENSVIAGVPAKLVRRNDNSEANLFNARMYKVNAENYTARNYRLEAQQLADLVPDDR
ncbi:gamma carbonic anhydrase family protein [uncultured Tateyamaria sp.]|uniref:gamma carbonic anhydrase family protein n=1 Tax=uncultured Tateyamaria sp. TaxID=455651 RepID=UPI002611F716|nr:gamma carbonic anhydrase family protein [uncultured Tateyamaria sp.]